MDEEIDEIVIPSLFKYKDYELKAVNRAGADEELGEEKNKDAEKDLKPVIEK